MPLNDILKKKCSIDIIEFLEAGISSDEENMSLLVQLTDEVDAATASSYKEAIDNSNAEVIKEIPFINTNLVSIRANKLEELLKNPAVRFVTFNHTYFAVLELSTKVIAEPTVPTINLDGSGVTVAVLDTGIYPHKDLITPNNRIIAFYDAFKKRESEPFDDNGHGTHCAGCVAGNGISSEGRFHGLAPNAKLVGVKVLRGAEGGGPTDVIVHGIKWCIENKQRFGIKVMSLSLSREAYVLSENDPLCKAIRMAQLAGIIVVVAAGNSGRDGSQTIGSPGIEPSIITVGATNHKNTLDKNDDVIAEFSSRGPTIDGLIKPDIVAPGTNIISLRAPSSSYDREYPQNHINESYTTMSGTSMSTPIVAGCVALLLQKKPDSKPSGIKEALRNGAVDIFHNENNAGKGYTNLQGALNKLNV